MRSIHIALALGAAMLLNGSRAASDEPDWHQWRGPQRNGIVAQSPALRDVYPDKGFKPVWQSDTIPGAGVGGWGSPVVAQGRVFMCANHKYNAKSDKRKITDRSFGDLGWHVDMPEDLEAKVEAARLSKERADLPREDLHPWIGEWADKNIPKDQKRFAAVCYMRLLFGARAVSPEVMKKLEGIKDQFFESQQAFSAWLKTNVADPKWIKAVNRAAWKGEPMASDQVLCLDAATGKQVWSAKLPGVNNRYASSATPCVAGGRCYVMGTDARVYCLDAKTGAMVWQVKTESDPKSTSASSIVVQDGVAVLLAKTLTGLDADTGDVVWTQPAVKSASDFQSPAYWHHAGKVYLVCCGDKETHCVEPKTGRVVWTVPGGGWSTPAIVGDYMAVLTNRKKVGLLAYKLDGQAPRKLWSAGLFDRGASPLIHDGFVYAFGGRSGARGICVELETGRVAWETKLPATEFSSPVLADGKLFLVVGRAFLYVIKASPEAFTLSGKLRAPVVNCTSPALVDGRLYVRQRKNVVCYDVRKPD